MRQDAVGREGRREERQLVQPAAEGLRGIEAAAHRGDRLGHVDGAVDQPPEQRLAVSLGAQRRVHLAAGLVGRPLWECLGVAVITHDGSSVFLPKSVAPCHSGIGQHEMMRTSLAGDRQAAFLGGAQ